MEVWQHVAGQAGVVVAEPALAPGSHPVVLRMERGDQGCRCSSQVLHLLGTVSAVSGDERWVLWGRMGAGCSLALSSHAQIPCRVQRSAGTELTKHTGPCLAGQGLKLGLGGQS